MMLQIDLSRHLRNHLMTYYVQISLCMYTKSIIMTFQLLYTDTVLRCQEARMNMNLMIALVEGISFELRWY